MNRPDTSLWTFCLSFYAFPQVESICLELQDRSGVNINSLLWAMWLDRIEPPIAINVWADGHKKIAVWRRGVISPLRQLRRILPKRKPWLAVRTRFQRWELRAEKRELEQLQQIARSLNAVKNGHSTDRVFKKLDDWYFLRQLLQSESTLCEQLMQLFERWHLETIRSRVD